MVFSNFTELFNQCHNPILKQFIIPKANILPISIYSHFSTLQALGNQ